MTMKLSPKSIFAGLAVYFGMAGGTYLYIRATKPPSTCECQKATKIDEEAIFERLADEYDTKIGFDETVMGIKLLRWWLMRKLEGNVLEVSAGTGRNLPYYNFDKLQSLTLTDTSRQMLINAQDKYKEIKGRRQNSSQNRVDFCLGDGHQLVKNNGANATHQLGAHPSQADTGVDAETPHGPALRTVQTFSPQTFDAVVDTFGLCSHDDPVQVLKEMAKACKPGGKIVLLEHGRSSWGFINKILDNGADEHKQKWGCLWNKDIVGIVRQAGLKIDSMRRWHFGTTYVIVAEPTTIQTWRSRC